MIEINIIISDVVLKGAAVDGEGDLCLSCVGCDAVDVGDQRNFREFHRYGCSVDVPFNTLEQNDIVRGQEFRRFFVSESDLTTVIVSRFNAVYLCGKGINVFDRVFRYLRLRSVENTCRTNISDFNVVGGSSR